MKKALFVLLLAAAAFVGCQKPAEVAVPAADEATMTATATDTTVTPAATEAGK